MIAVVHVMEDLLVQAGSSSFGSKALPSWSGSREAVKIRPAAVRDEVLGNAGEAEVPGDGGNAELHVQGIAAAMLERIGRERFDLWIDGKTRFTLAGNTLVVEAVNGFVAKWIATKFRADLLESARGVIGREVELCVRVGEELQGRQAAGEQSESATPAKNSGGAAAYAGRTTWQSSVPAPVMNPKYTLEEFVVGPSNHYAYHAATLVASRPGEQFNPLFIHGHCGLGKTHLLQGICQRFAKLHPGKKWLYLTGEQFTNEFLEAIRAHKTDAFRRRIRQTDLLVIDDVHFLANKKATQEEFLHTFNQVDANGKQIVLASDCAPKQILSLSEQLSSRFVSGMVLRVDSPDLPTRLEILRRRAARNGWNISDAVLMHVAQSSTSSVRELEGLLMQVVAGMRLIDGGLMGAGAGPETGVVMASIRERTAMRGPVPAERIILAVAEHFALQPAAILGNGREKAVSSARAVAMYLARQHSGMSFPEIGRAMGNKNHSTVIAACQRVEGMVSGGALLCWNTPAGPRHQAVSDVLHDLDAAIRKVGGGR